MDPEVAQTISALERKLAELERELGAVSGRQDGATLAPSGGPAAGATAPGAPVPDAPAPGAPAPGTAAAGAPALAPARGYPVAGGPGQVAAVLVDEAVQQRFSMEARETVYGEIPATKDERKAIDLGELVRFKETMQRTLQGLIDEYSRLLSLKPPSDA